MRTKMNKKCLKTGILTLFFAIIITLLAEVTTAGFTYLKAGNTKGLHLIAPERITYEGTDENGSFSGANGGKIKLSFPMQYVNKFEFYYIANGEFIADIHIKGKDVYGNSETFSQKDFALEELNHSVINVKREIEEIVIDVLPNQEEVIGQIDRTYLKNAESIRIDNLTINNRFNMNKYRAVFYFTIIAIALFLFTYRKRISQDIALGFLVISLILGTAFVYLLPPNLTGWDEHLHITAAYTLLDKGENSMPESALYMHTHPERFHTPAIQTEEEKSEIITYYNKIGKNEIPFEGYTQGLRSFGYLLSAVVIKVFEFFKAPFYSIYLAGKMCNLIFYSLMVYWSIKHTKIGKALFTAIGLYPLTLFITSIYTYDIMVIACMIAGISILVSEFVTPKEKMKTRNVILFLLFMVIGCIPKAVYIPLLFIAAFLPKSKFENKRQTWIFRGAIIVAFFLLLSTFILPTLLNPPSVGDARGGNTSTAEQLRLIFSQPFSYASVLWQNVKNTFGYYMFGGSEQTILGYLGIMNSSYLLAIYLFIVTLTDTGYTHNGKALSLRPMYKGFLALGCIGSIVLIWTALYLSFTEVGKLQIAGVQGRYYLPFMIVFFLLLQTQKIQVLVTKVKYNLIILGVSSFFVIKNIYDLLWSAYIL